MLPLSNILPGKNKSHFYIVFDIGTHSIRSFIVEKRADSVICLKRQARLLSRKSDSPGLAGNIGERIHEIIFNYIKSSGTIPAGVLIGLGPTLSINVLTNIKKQRANAKKLVDDKEISNVMGEHTYGVKEIKADSSVFKLMHAEPVHVSVDGYNLSEAANVYGAALEVKVSLTYIREDLANELDELHRVFGGLKIDMRPTHLAVLDVIMKLKPANNFFLIKIGGKVTEVIFIENGFLSWVEQLFFGSEEVTENISETLGVTLANAEDIKKQFGRLILPENTTRAVEEISKDHAQKLAEEIRQIFLNRQLPLPPEIYLYGGGVKDAFIKTILSDKRRFHDITSADEVQVNVLQAESVAQGALENDVLRGPEDVDLASLAVSVSRKNG